MATPYVRTWHCWTWNGYPKLTYKKNKSIWLILIAVLASGYTNGKQRAGAHIEALLTSTDDSCFFKITNNSDHDIYLLPGRNFSLTIVKNKIIFAPFYTEPGFVFLPDAFIPPVMRVLKSHESRCVRNKEVLAKNDTVCYIRVYGIPYTKYVILPSTGYAPDFIEHQKRHSVIVRCKVVSRNEVCL